jgi:hypothetical protein
MTVNEVVSEILLTYVSTLLARRNLRLDYLQSIVSTQLGVHEAQKQQEGRDKGRIGLERVIDLAILPSPSIFHSHILELTSHRL